MRDPFLVNETPSRSVGRWPERGREGELARACASLLTPDPPRLSFRKSSGKEQEEERRRRGVQWKWAKEYSQRASEQRRGETDRPRSCYSEERERR